MPAVSAGDDLKGKTLLWLMVLRGSAWRGGEGVLSDHIMAARKRREAGVPTWVAFPFL